MTLSYEFLTFRFHSPLLSGSRLILIFVVGGFRLQRRFLLGFPREIRCVTQRLFVMKRLCT